MQVAMSQTPEDLQIKSAFNEEEDEELDMISIDDEVPPVSQETGSSEKAEQIELDNKLVESSSTELKEEPSIENASEATQSSTTAPSAALNEKIGGDISSEEAPVPSESKPSPENLDSENLELTSKATSDLEDHKPKVDGQSASSNFKTEKKTPQQIPQIPVDSLLKSFSQRELEKVQQEALSALNEEVHSVLRFIEEQRKIQGTNLLQKIAKLYGLEISVHGVDENGLANQTILNHKRPRESEEESRQVRKKTDSAGIGNLEL